MASITPNGDIYLIKDVPFNPSYDHSIRFSSTSAQISYLTASSRVCYHLTNQNYVKTEAGKIRIKGNDSGHGEDICYMAWNNPDIGSGDAKWVFAFVTNVDLVSAEVLEITYVVDVLQTYVIRNRVSFKECYIERRHTGSDDFGEHIEPEPIVSNRYVYGTPNISKFYEPNIENWAVLVYAAKSRSEGTNVKTMGYRAGLPQGLYCNVFLGNSENTAYDEFASWLNSRTEEEFTEWVNNIVAVVAVPSEFVSASSGGLAKNSPWRDVTKYVDAEIQTIDGYTPKNKKLLTYPYNCLHISNQDGIEEDLAYEFCTINNSNQIRFICALAIQPQPELIVAPYGYKGYPQGNPNYEAKIVIKDFPPIPWVGDAYKQYLGSQGMQNAFNLIKNAFAGATSGAFLGGGNPIAAVAGAATGVMGTAIQQGISGEQAKIGTNEAHAASNSAMLALGQKAILTVQKCICKEDAKRIDDYFTRYGYAIGRIGTPNLSNGRKNQHYIKTRDCLVVGDCPAEYCRQIESIFDKGITWWDSDNVGNYN